MFSGAMRGGAGPTPSRSPSHPRSALWGVGARGRVCKRAGRAWGPREERSLAGPWTFRAPPLASSGLPLQDVTWGARRRQSWPLSVGRNFLHSHVARSALGPLFGALPASRNSAQTRSALAPPPLGSVLRRYLARPKSDVSWVHFNSAVLGSARWRR